MSSSYEKPSFPNIEWQWFDKNANPPKWITATESDSIEEEYQTFLKGEQSGQRVFHCFGDLLTAGVNYNSMKTYCLSWKCQAFLHKSNYNPGQQAFLGGFPRDVIEDDHLIFDVRRIVKNVWEGMADVCNTHRIVKNQK